MTALEILFAEDRPPNVADFVIKDYEDIARFEVPDDITQHPAWSTIAAWRPSTT